MTDRNILSNYIEKKIPVLKLGDNHNYRVARRLMASRQQMSERENHNYN